MTMRNAHGAARGFAAAVATMVTIAGCGEQVEVRTAARGPISEWVEATGKARVRERHVVSTPVPGALARVEVHPGDAVRRGDVLAYVLPLAPTPLDVRTRAELEARRTAARAAEKEALAALRRARVAQADSERALARARTLSAGAAIPVRELEAAEAANDAAAQQVEAARAAVERARGERIAVEALLGGARPAPNEAIGLRAPVAGVVLRVTQESPGPVQAGTAILEVGDPVDLEIALELLTEQASRVRPGAPVEIGGWGGDSPLSGIVRRVEPSAFTKVSALGVEEQRVLVLVDPAAPRDAWAPLRDGWRVEGRVAVAYRASAVKVPSSSVFRGDAGWATYVVEAGRARLRPVRIGAAGRDEVEILSGVAEGEHVVVHPSSALEDGARVRSR